MSKVKVATSASYFTNPAVLELLRQQDLVMTTNSDAIAALDRLLCVPVVHIPEAGLLNDRDRLVVFINAFYPRERSITADDIEITHFGNLVKVHEANPRSEDAVNAAFKASSAAGAQLVAAIEADCAAKREADDYAGYLERKQGREERYA